MSASAEARFIGIGLDEKVAKEAAVGKVAKILEDVIDESGLKTADKSFGVLLYVVASTLNPTHSSVTTQHRKNLVKLIVDGKIKTRKQVDEGIKYLKKANSFAQSDLETSTGVGVAITTDTIHSEVNKIIKANDADLKKQGYKITGKLLGQLNAGPLLWADGGEVKKIFDDAILKAIGPKPDYSEEKKSAPTPAGTVPPKKQPVVETKTDDHDLTAAQANIFADLSFLDEGREIAEARNLPEQIEEKNKHVGNKIITRFPPEPNGFLHIGHAKAMRFNFGIAKSRDGDCIMRFDDTNPEAEKKLYIDNILENVTWLGHKPARVTFSSDYFQQLYDLAVKLIKKGLAYVDHQTPEEIEKSRTTKIGSPYRDRPIEESLRLFEDMRKGKYAEGKATLRMKGDMQSPNPQMWDLVAYRIKYTPHPHVGDKWCIYPSYDYTHCIIDSLEWITYSCCTLEFEVRRESYFWLLWHLDLYKPKVWEYSRLNIEHNVLSKRRLLRLVMDKHVNGWDDPRLLTLNGLRRRGFTADAINHFCDVVGVSRTMNMIPYTRLEHSGRLHLDSLSRRVMVVEQPIRVTLINYPEGKVEKLKAPDWPQKKDPAEQHPHDVYFSRVLYIDASDVRLVDDKDFFGLAPGKEVHLKYAYNITAKEIKTHADGSIAEVIATVDLENKNKCKGKIHWVAQPKGGVEPLRVELRLYEVLFKSPDPMAIDDWVQDLNPNSLTTVYGYADPSVATAKPGDHFQFERNAFFVCDLDSTKSHLIFNRTVSLKESKPKSDDTKNESAKKENAKPPAAADGKGKKPAKK